MTWAGSRLPAARTSMMGAPAGMVVPATSMSSSAVRNGHEVHGRLVAQQFLDHRDGQVRVVAQPLQHCRVAQQGQHAVGDEVDGGLVPGDEQQHRGADHCSSGMRPSGPSSVAIAGEQVGAGCRRWASTSSPRYARSSLPASAAACLAVFRDPSPGSVDCRAVHPDPEALFVARGHAEQLADHRDRERVGEVVDDVDPGAARQSSIKPVTIAVIPAPCPRPCPASWAGRSGAWRAAAAGRGRAGRCCMKAESCRGRPRRCSGSPWRPQQSARGCGESELTRGSCSSATISAVGADDVAAVREPRHRGLAQLGVQRVRVGAGWRSRGSAPRCSVWLMVKAP